MQRREQHSSGSCSLRQYGLLATALTFFFLVAVTAQAQTFTLLHNFNGGDGWNPVSGLTVDRAGNFYGTTDVGGTGNRGTVYRLSHKGSGWILTTLYSFSGKDDGGYVYAGVAFGPDGALYGTTGYGGQDDHGVVYRLTPQPSSCKSALCPWNETVLHSFTGGSNDGEDPGEGNLVFDKAGSIYGATATGGYGYGVAYEVSPSSGGWTFKLIYDFQANNGFNANSGLIFDNAGNLYGTLINGSGSYSGTVFELSPNGSNWTETVLSPIEFMDTATCSGVVMDPHGNLFGTSGCDSLGKPGGVYELTNSDGSWTFNALYKFSFAEGPAAPPTLDAAGNVYGTTTGGGLYGYGEVFKLTPSNGSWTFTDLYDFTGGADGAYPGGPVYLDASGNLYGTTAYGGTGLCQIEQYTGCGVIWEITP